MGCSSSAQNEVVTPEKKQISEIVQQQQQVQVQIKDIKDLNITYNGLIQERYGRISKDYIIMNPPLGKGAFGEVRRAIHKITEAQRAIKIISKEQTSIEEQLKLTQEVEILKKLDHPNIIQIYEFYQDAKYFYIVTELCTGGELFDQITQEKIFSEKKASETMYQILRAVHYCHKNGIVHRDLKPENILYESKQPGAPLKIVDFGTSRIFDNNSKMNQKIGTPFYIAPEVIDSNYNEKCDIWSCGVILYMILCGYPPFYGGNERQIMDKVKIGKYSFEDAEWGIVSDEAKQLITKMLEKDIQKRYSAEQCLNDVWFEQYSKKTQVNMPDLQKALSNMRHFRADKKLQEATWIFIMNTLASREEKLELMKVFQALDLNNDGKLSQEELLIGYSKMMPKDQAIEEVQHIMQNVDKNNSHSIDYSEFVMACLNREKNLQKQKLETAFKMFDQDKSGTITTDEIKQMLGNGSNIDQKVWDDILKEVDENGDGSISLQEFKDMMVQQI